MTSPATLPARGIFRVLVCRITHSLGNTLLLTPLIREIETVYPGAEIDILTRSTIATEIFGTFRCVRNIYLLPAHAFHHPYRFINTLRRVQRGHYDLVIDPCPRSRTGRLTLLLAEGRYKLGFAYDGKASEITHLVALPSTPLSAGQLSVFLLRTARDQTAFGAYPTPDIALSPVEHAAGLNALAQLTPDSPGASSKKGVIGVFANATGPKSLGSAWWHSFMDVLETYYEDYSIIEIVPMTGRSLLDCRYPAYYSSSIRKLASVLAGLSMFVSADCGVMHLACASGVPVMAIFTVTDPVEWGPYGPYDEVIDARDLSPGQAAHRTAVLSRDSMEHRNR